MSEAGEMAAWTRKQVEARLALAREACHGSDGHWWRRAHSPYLDSAGTEPTGPLYAGEPVTDPLDGEVTGGAFTVVYDEGAPSEAEFAHMQANDPRDVIARCEAELAILDDHVSNENEAYPECRHCAVEHYPCRTVRLIGLGYRHKDGYREQEWKP